MRHRISLLIVVAFLGASCGGTDAALNPTQPSPAASKLSVGVRYRLHRWLSRRG